MIIARKEKWGRRSGVILVSDGFLESLAQMTHLRNELQALRTERNRVRSEEEASARLSTASRELFEMMPAEARHSLLFLNDLDGMPLLPTVEPERLLARLLQDHLREVYASESFIARYHHIGVEGRCPVPTQFDATFGWALGHCAAALVQAKKNGYIACISDLLQPPGMWSAHGVPFSALLRMGGADVVGGGGPPKGGPSLTRGGEVATGAAGPAAGSGPPGGASSPSARGGGRRVAGGASQEGEGPQLTAAQRAAAAREAGRNAGLRRRGAAAPISEKKNVNLRLDPIYLAYKKVSLEQVGLYTHPFLCILTRRKIFVHHMSTPPHVHVQGCPFLSIQIQRSLPRRITDVV